MSEPSLQFVSCPNAQGSHRMAYWQWGKPDSPHMVLCVHGLTRQGRDFDAIAQTLCARAGGNVRVVCPDVVGRGRSDWLHDPQAYQMAQYVADMLVLLKQLQPVTLDWIGTSMGGLIGMALASLPELPAFARIHRLVLNDVGPVLAWQAIQRIGQYLGKPGVFESEQQAADAMWQVSSSFGPHTPQQWLALSRHLLKPVPDGSGRLTLRYDPGIADTFLAMTEASASQGEQLLWQAYDHIAAPTLLLRGAESDLLTSTTALAMTQRGPRARLVEFAGVGHAPTLIAPDQQQAVVSFLLD